VVTWWKRLERQIESKRRQLIWQAVHWGWREFQQAGMVTADTPAGKAFARFGRGSLISFPSGSVFGQGWIEIGEDTLIGAQVSISAGIVPGQDLGPQTVLRVGDRCVIGRGSHIVAHESVEIGDDVWTGPYVYITDQNHAYEDLDVPIGRQFPVNRPVSIGSGSWLGRHVVIAAGSVVRGVIPDRCVVAGVPARIIREHTDAGWLSPKAPA